MVDQHEFVVVAHRLPVDGYVDEGGQRRWRRSPGGVAAVLRDVTAGKKLAWVGWSGLGDHEDEDEPAATDEHEGISLYQVPLTVDEVERHYEGFCNSTIWPLFHDSIERAEHRRRWWEAYRTVNARFAAAAAEVAAGGAVVWIHDYQLMLVPAMLREMRPDLRIGFFLHVPFPGQESFMQLPRRAEILRGLLGADLVGVQRPLAAENLASIAKTLFGLRVRGGDIEVGDRRVRARAFPISIDVEATERLATDPSIQARAREIRAELGEPRTVLLGIDRLDYTKGIEQRLIAYGELLHDGRLAPDSVVFVQIAPRSREGAARYQQLRERIELLTGHLNGQYGRVGASVLYTLHQAYDVREAAALYLVADVMVVTPFRDGMNLIAKEYVASRTDDSGALVLSEFAGAAGELRQSYLVNPYDIDGLKDAMVRAVHAEPVEARRRMRAMRRYLRVHDAHHWATSFLDVLGG